ncbi:MAG: class I SAM-dependent methyltransferase [Bacteroidota bacterium]
MAHTSDSAYQQFWDTRYAAPEFGYGEAPNVFFNAWLPKFAPGHILMPAEGEGRNGVYAARQGWQVTACDLSSQGKEKALALASQHQVSLSYQVGDLEEMDFAPAQFDAIGLIYAHFLPAKKSLLHASLHKWLKPGGVIIFEAFGKNHLPFKKANPKVGGPGDLDMLYSTAEIEQGFAGYEIMHLAEEVVQLNEGAFHIGEGSVVRFVGRKA